MAFSAKILCSLFLCFNIFSLQVHAREGLFFSKVSRSNIKNNKVEATGLPSTEASALPTTEVNVTNQNDEAQPTFTPEVHNGYGLYGREMDQGANLPEKTSTEEYNGGENSEYMFNNGVPFDSQNKDNNVVNEAKQYGMSDTRYQDSYDENNLNDNNNNYNANSYDENQHNSMNDNNNNYNANNYGYENKQNSLNGNNNNNYNYNANNYGYENKQNSLNGNNNNYNANNYGYENKQNSFNNGNNANYNRYQYPAQQQGMSDTRFLENGKYFYDLNNEELYKNRYQYQTVRRRNDDVLGSSSLYKFNNMETNQNNQGEYVP